LKQRFVKSIGFGLGIDHLDDRRVSIGISSIVYHNLYTSIEPSMRFLARR